MSLKNYLACDEKHESQFEFVCLKQKMIFCGSCWYKKQHYSYCESTRCGHIKKIAHLALNRGLFFTNNILVQNLSPKEDVYQYYRKRFLEISFQITRLLKQQIERKVPLYIWSSVNQLLKQHFNPQDDISDLKKFQVSCSEMIKIIKPKKGINKYENMEKVIGTYYEINHEIEGSINKYKNGHKFDNPNNKEDILKNVLNSYKEELPKIYNTFITNTKKMMEEEMQRIVGLTDKNIKYTGINFEKITAKNENFRMREQHPYVNFFTNNFSKITDQQADLFNGYTLKISEFQSNPQNFLQMSKTILKEKLFSIFHSISKKKSSYPYRYCYLMATTLSKDEEYEEMMVEIEKQNLNITLNAQIPVYGSSNIIIMGEELIVININNQSQGKSFYSRKIYNYKKTRQKHYKNLLKILELEKLQKRDSLSKNIQFKSQLSQKQLVYCIFRLAYQQIFLTKKNDNDNFNEKEISQVGSIQINNLIEQWQKYKNLNIVFDVPLKEMIKHFV